MGNVNIEKEILKLKAIQSNPNEKGYSDNSDYRTGWMMALSNLEGVIAKRREIVRLSQEKRRAKFKANGKCIQCGRPSVKSLCPDCMRKQAIANKKYKEKKG